MSRMIEAATDPNIVDYFVKGAGTEEALIAYLERVYDLTEAEVVSAIDLAIGNLHEITDYGEA
jgi:DNA-binding transcriptional regulator LsrR (DeoR family)